MNTSDKFNEAFKKLCNACEEYTRMLDEADADIIKTQAILAKLPLRDGYMHKINAREGDDSLYIKLVGREITICKTDENCIPVMFMSGYDRIKISRYMPQLIQGALEKLDQDLKTKDSDGK